MDLGQKLGIKFSNLGQSDKKSLMKTLNKFNNRLDINPEFQQFLDQRKYPKYLYKKFIDVLEMIGIKGIKDRNTNRYQPILNLAISYYWDNLRPFFMNMNAEKHIIDKNTYYDVETRTDSFHIKFSVLSQGRKDSKVYPIEGFCHNLLTNQIFKFQDPPNGMIMQNSTATSIQRTPKTSDEITDPPIQYEVVIVDFTQEGQQSDISIFDDNFNEFTAIF